MWESEMMKLRRFGILEMWEIEMMKIRRFGILEMWESEMMKIRRFGILEMCENKACNASNKRQDFHKKCEDILKKALLRFWQEINLDWREPEILERNLDYEFSLKTHILNRYNLWFQ